MGASQHHSPTPASLESAQSADVPPFFCAQGQVIHYHRAMADLTSVLDRIAPEIKKWATVVLVDWHENKPTFSWHDYKDSGQAQDFWPASCIKLYAAVAFLELLAAEGFPLATTVIFERQTDGCWELDCARTAKEMLSEVFRRSSNEDYTLLLRAVGIDRINTKFLRADRGFAKSALMRGYVTARPWVFPIKEPQRITLRSVDGRTKILEHTWTGVSYSEQRGATIIDAKTGNVTTTREMAECLRRILYHEHLPEHERYHFTAEQLDFLRHGSGGLVGLKTKAKESGPAAWTGGVESVFPHATFYHKCGLISNYCLEVAAVDDTKDSGKSFLLVPAINAGYATKPDGGEKLLGGMARAIAEWVRGQ